MTLTMGITVCIYIITIKYSFVLRVDERKRIYYRGKIEIRAYLVETTTKSQLLHEAVLFVGGNGFKIPTSIRRKPRRPANDRLFADARCASICAPYRLTLNCMALLLFYY